ncbi:hypothetical protein K3F44_09590 [Pseudomonas sp. S07E 245]|uniref:hypothetical protein n=1 Tax=Pseudomonas sp. S07E 245 TaxID=2866278 RepID=UPI001C73A240|nr:hypothetical protein [Pseudomonas sp. S07E 245]QYX54518.1 hypothetical protein K3F44_09590 [Pseudomonas sp. S07E 245]
MSDEHDLHEPEHDHLLDHEFLYEDFAPEADAQGLLDEVDDSDDDYDHPAWHDDVDD